MVYDYGLTRPNEILNCREMWDLRVNRVGKLGNFIPF